MWRRTLWAVALVAVAAALLAGGARADPWLKGPACNSKYILRENGAHELGEFMKPDSAFNPLNVNAMYAQLKPPDVPGSGVPPAILLEVASRLRLRRTERLPWRLQSGNAFRLMEDLAPTGEQAQQEQGAAPTGNLNPPDAGCVQPSYSLPTDPDAPQTTQMQPTEPLLPSQMAPPAGQNNNNMMMPPQQ